MLRNLLACSAVSRASEPAVRSLITIATASSISSSRTTSHSISPPCPAPESPRCVTPKGFFCGPRGLPYGRHSLYHNNGDGTFSDITVSSGIGAVAGGYGLTAVAADFDNDGWPDIYLACDSTPSLFFHNNHDGTFTEQAMERGVALSEDGMEQAGMGIAVGDLLPTGTLDIVKTHFAADTPAVYGNNGKGEFRDDTIHSGLGVETRYISWGVGIQDLDNDGLNDVFWVTGGIYPELRNRPDEPYTVPRIVFRNLGNGRFEEIISGAGPGIEARHCSRGCAFGDFDNDGDMDVLIMNLNEPPSLLRNDLTGEGHWIKVKFARRALQSKCDWSSRHCSLRREHTIAGSRRAILLPFGERSPITLWSWLR